MWSHFVEKGWGGNPYPQKVDKSRGYPVPLCFTITEYNWDNWYEEPWDAFKNCKEIKEHKQLGWFYSSCALSSPFYRF